MAEMVGLSRTIRRRKGAIGGLLATMKTGFARLTGRDRADELRLAEWSDYLLRDIGLDRSIRDEIDPRAKSTDWLMR